MHERRNQSKLWKKNFVEDIELYILMTIFLKFDGFFDMIYSFKVQWTEFTAT